MHKRKIRTIVEMGTARNGECNCTGDGCSAPIWGQWAKQNDAFIYSVDIDPEAIRCSSAACMPYLDHMTFVTSDSVAFLAKFNKPIDFLYLDSYDLDLANPQPSQEHHLKEIIAAYPWPQAKSIIMIDDCRFSLWRQGKIGNSLSFRQRMEGCFIWIPSDFNS
ncbi:MAG: hypothetical protein LVR00_05730 [Rhabdochlamydiaceae bacterium]|jgi:hypothetical protein